MALDTSIYFQAPIVGRTSVSEQRATQQQLRLRDFQLAEAERAQQAAQRQAQNERRLDDILRDGGAQQPMPMGGAMGQDGPQSAPVKSLSDLAFSVPGYAGGRYPIGGSRSGAVDRLGGRSRQQIYDQITQQIGPAQADEWLQKEMSFDKGFAETSKEQAGAAEAWAKVDSQTLQNAVAETQRAASLMAYVTSQADLDRVRAQLAAEGNDDADGIPEIYQSGLGQQWTQRAMGVVKSAEMELEKRKAAETERANRERERLTVRGQNMTDARERERLKGQGSELPKPPPGYRYVQGGNLEPIPGGPAAQRTEQAEQKQQLASQGQEQKAMRLIADIDSAIKDVGFWSAGMGTGKLSEIRGTSAYNLERKLETIKANLGFQELQAMRDASPTGGALGAIAVQELVALQSTVASLDAGQSPEQLREGLEKIRQHYQNWLNAVRQPRVGEVGEVPEFLRNRGGTGSGAGSRAPQVQSLYDEFGLED